MKNLAIIPARMESSRFPGKPLAKICGIPMIAHCFERASLAKNVDTVYVSTPNDEIYLWCQANEIPCVITSAEHERATERIHETLQIVDPTNQVFSKIIMVQGDEPEISPSDIENLIVKINSNTKICNLVCRISKDKAADKNSVKTVISNSHEAIFFSRSLVPWNCNHYFRQLGLIGFTPEALNAYVEFNQTSIERIESIDMMRFIENNFSISVSYASKDIFGVDLLEHLAISEQSISKDDIFPMYRDKYLGTN